MRIEYRQSRRVFGVSVFSNCKDEAPLICAFQLQADSSADAMQQVSALLHAVRALPNHSNIEHRYIKVDRSAHDASE